MKPENISTIVAVIMAVILAMIAYFRDSEKAQKIERAAMIALMVLTLVSLLIIRYQIIPRIERNQALASLIEEERLVKETLETYNAAKPVVALAPPPFRDLFSAKVTEHNAYLSDVADGTFPVPPDKIISTASELIQTAQRTIFGTSYIKSGQWWGTPAGQKYLQLHADLLKRGVAIHRLFVFSSEQEMRDDVKIMEVQKNMGIRVFYVMANDVINYPNDMIMIDEAVSGELHLTPDKGMRQAHFYYDERNLKRIRREIESLFQQAKEFP